MRRLITLFILIGFPIWVSGQFQQQAEHSLRVSGIFITREVPEIIILSLNVNYSSLDYGRCSDSLLIVAGSVSDRFIENGIDKDKIKISQLSLNENYTYESNKRVKTGYKGDAQIEIRDNFSQEFAERMFNTIGSLKFATEYTVSFSLSEQQKEKLRRLSLEKAIADAKEKAEIIAALNNLELVKINRIDFENNNFYLTDDDLAFEEISIPMIREDILSNLDLHPKELSITRSVLIEWIIKERDHLQ
jgi:uncharacterized protein YggE